MNYKMTLIVEGLELNIPVLPAKLNVSSPGKNEKLTVLETGEILVLRKKGLRTVSWGQLFPGEFRPLYHRPGKRPSVYRKGHTEGQGRPETDPLPDHRNRPGL